MAEPRRLCFSLPPVDLKKQTVGGFLYASNSTRKTSTSEGPIPRWNSTFNIVLHGETVLCRQKITTSRNQRLYSLSRSMGNTRGAILVNEECSNDNAFKKAASDNRLPKYLDEKGFKQRIHVPARILNVILDQQKAASL